MNKLKAYVGLNNRFVMCESFPDDEEHAGLHEMLQDFIGYDDVLTDEDMEQGFYMLEFDVEQDIGSLWGLEPSDPYLVVTKAYPIRRKIELSEVTEEEMEGLPND